jgi:hypothetical protein
MRCLRRGIICYSTRKVQIGRNTPAPLPPPRLLSHQSKMLNSAYFLFFVSHSIYIHSLFSTAGFEFFLISISLPFFLFSKSSRPRISKVWCVQLKMCLFYAEKSPFRSIAAIWAILEHFYSTQKWQLSQFFVEVCILLHMLSLLSYFTAHEQFSSLWRKGKFSAIVQCSRTLEKCRLFRKVGFQPHFANVQGFHLRWSSKIAFAQLFIYVDCHCTFSQIVWSHVLENVLVLCSYMY